MIPVICVDGPSGVGKGTLCGHLSRRLGFHLLDSGSLYRLVGLIACETGVAPSDEAACLRIAENLDAHFEHHSGTLHVLLGERDVSGAIRTEQASQWASKVAALPGVRQALLEWQRRQAVAPGLVADGRDMGTEVFPTAGLKVFMEASSEERARRRYQQLIEMGQNVTLRAVLEDIETRDARDRGRQTAPLRAAPDARILDTTTLSIGDVLAQVDDWCDDFLKEFKGLNP